MERLPGDDRVGGRVRKRHRLGRALDRAQPPAPRRAAASSISGNGSTAVTRWPSRTSTRVSFPVPAARSTTSCGDSPASQRTASAGYSGRARSYASATDENDAARRARSSPTAPHDIGTAPSRLGSRGVEATAIVERLSQLALFADLSWAEVESVAHVFDEEAFAAGQRVLRQGLSGSAFYVILDGEAIVAIDGRDRRRLGRGDFFGEISALTGEPPSADVRAETVLRCLVIPGRSSSRFLLQRPAVTLRMLQAEALRLRDSHRWEDSGGRAAVPSRRLRRRRRRQRARRPADELLPRAASASATPSCPRTTGRAACSAAFPLFERLISWTHHVADPPRESRGLRGGTTRTACSPRSRSFAPSSRRTWPRAGAARRARRWRPALRAFAERAPLPVRYGCRWDVDRREDDDRLVLVTEDGEYRCRAAVFAVGMTDPWVPPIPGPRAREPLRPRRRLPGPLPRPARRDRRQAELRLRGRRGDPARRAPRAHPRVASLAGGRQAGPLAASSVVPDAVRRARARRAGPLRPRRLRRARRALGRRLPRVRRRSPRAEHARARSRRRDRRDRLHARRSATSATSASRPSPTAGCPR